MARQKQSFFGKIMGGDVTEDEEEKIVEYPADEYEAEEDEEDLDEAEELTDEDLAEDELEEDDESGYEENYQEEMVAVESDPEEEIPQPVSAGMNTKQDEDWMADYEGALNIDMYQTKDNVIIKSTIAGVSPADIDITVANDMVTIKGTRYREEKIDNEDYFYQECYYGNFSRSVLVPVDIDSENIEADLKSGILTVIIPKAAKAKTKKVKVKGL